MLLVTVIQPSPTILEQTMDSSLSPVTNIAWDIQQVVSSLVEKISYIITQLVGRDSLFTLTVIITSTYIHIP